ncbi:hypothetical protein ACRPLQ_11485 [Priestia sp. TRN 1309]|uniref:hypothetical protein n=1 Tax=Priestia sp. TRN 1309 TaxID=3420729 RepID=UPI003D76C921
MSYYDKKYIKGEHKKHECKDDCKMEYHKHYEKEEEENGLLTEFDVAQAPSVPLSFTGLPNLANAFAEVEVCADDRDDRVALDLTVQWQPTAFTLTTLVATLITAIGTLLGGAGVALPLAVPATFRIWRKSSSGTVLISEKTDSSAFAAIQVLGIATPLLSIPFEPIVTTIHAVDTDPDLGENEYFATINLGPFPTGTVFPTATAAGVVSFVPLAQSGVTLTPNNISSYTLTASEIEAND